MPLSKLKSKAASQSRRTTLKDVARSIGVSHVTVSLALKSDPQIPASTRERVIKAAQALNYVPHEGAQRLKTGRSGKIAYVAARLAFGFAGHVLAGVEQRAFELGLYENAIQPYSTWYHISTREEILRQILYGGQAEAVILVSMYPSPEIVLEYKRHDVPLILVEAKAPGCHSVRVDNALGARLATECLIQAGCKQVALVAGQLPPQDVELNPTVVERRQGFADAMAAAKLGRKLPLIADIRFYEFEEGRQALDLLLKQQPKLDGIFCAAGDRVALGIIERARELGLRIPQDLKLIGYDDLLESRFLDPPLSSVSQPTAQLGAEAFDLAIYAIKNPGQGEKHLFHKPKLVLRKTT